MLYSDFVLEGMARESIQQFCGTLAKNMIGKCFVQ